MAIQDHALGHADKVLPSVSTQDPPWMERFTTNGSQSPKDGARLHRQLASEDMGEKQHHAKPHAWGEQLASQLASQMESGPRHPKALFVNAQAMKEKVRKTLAGKRHYDVTDFYKTTGCPQRIARHPWFEYATLSVISLNALWIAIETDHNKADALLDADVGFILVENLFCAYFFGEWLMRFLSFQRIVSGLRDAWFVFDSLLVFSMVVETWVMAFVMKFTAGGASSGMGNASILRLARLLRLSRLARMVRLLRAMPELMILVKGMFAALRSVGFVMILLLFFIYVFAIFFTQMAAENEVLKPYFSGIGQSMYSLAMHGVFLEDLIVIMDILKAENAFLTGVFSIFVMIASMTMMNMLIGVLCEVVTAVSSTEKEALDVAIVKSKLQQVLAKLPSKAGQEVHDVQNLSITKDEYELIIETPQVARLLQEVGVDVVGLVDLTDLFFEDEDSDDEEGSASGAGRQTLSFGDLMESVLELRGTNNATVKDVMNLRKFIRTAIDTRMDRIEKSLCGGLLNKKSGLLRRGSEGSIGDKMGVTASIELRPASDLKDAGGSRPTTRRDLGGLGGGHNGGGAVQQAASPPGFVGTPPSMIVGYPSGGDQPSSPRSPQECPTQLLQRLHSRVDSVESSLKSRMESLESTMRLILERLPP